MKNAKSTITKSNIQDKLMELMRSTDIGRIKVTDITIPLNIHRSTFYLYYDSVYSVLQDIEDVYFAGLEKIVSHFWDYPLDKKYLSTPHPIMFETLSYIEAHKDQAPVLWGPHGDSLYQAKCRKSIKDSMFPPETAKKLYPENTAYYINFLLEGHVGMLNHWLLQGCPIPTEEMTIMSYRLMYLDLISKQESILC